MHPEGADANQNSHRTPRPGACRSGHDVSEWGKAEITPKPHSEKNNPRFGREVQRRCMPALTNEDLTGA